MNFFIQEINSKIHRLEYSLKFGDFIHDHSDLDLEWYFTIWFQIMQLQDLLDWVKSTSL